MTHHDDFLYLGHMLDMARKAVSKVREIDRGAFDNDENLRLALVHLVQVVGEAATRVSPATRAANPRIPWHDITGMRHRLVHDYTNVNEDIVWEVVTARLPALIEALETIVPPEPLE